MPYALPDEAQAILAIGVSIFFVAIVGIPLLLQLTLLTVAIMLLEWGLNKLRKPSILEYARKLSLRLYNNY